MHMTDNRICSTQHFLLKYKDSFNMSQRKSLCAVAMTSLEVV